MKSKSQLGWSVVLGCGLGSIFIYIQSAIAVPTAMIVEVKGKVEIQRKGTSEFISVGVWTQLYEGDLVKPASDAFVKVACPDGKVREIEDVGMISGLSKICSLQSSRATNSDTLPSRGEDDFLRYLDPRFFYTITLLDAKQVIRWQEVKGATGYQVKLGTRQEILLDRQVNKPEIIYTGDKTLQLGVEYGLIATALGSVDNAKFSLRFKILTEKEVQELGKKIAIVQTNPDLSEVAKAIALAGIYDEYRLAEQAIAELEKISQSDKSLTLVEQRLGNLLLQIGLKTKAERHFLKALILAREEKNFEAIAEAQIGIAKIFILDGNKKEASAWLNNTLGYYTELGNTKQIEQVKEWLKKIQVAVSQDTSPDEFFAITSKLLVSKAEQIYKEEGKFRYLNPEAEKRIQLALEIFTIERDIKGQATILNYLALAKFHAQGRYKESLPLFQKALELYQKDPNNLAAQEIVFFNIGQSYRYLRNFQEALNFYQKALATSLITNNCGGELDALRRIGIIYIIQEQDIKARETSKRIAILQKDEACLESSKTFLDPRTPIRGAW